MRSLNVIALVVFILLVASNLWSHQRAGAQKQRADAALQQLAAQQAAFQKLQQRQQEISQLDAHYSEELTHARLTIENLQRDVAAGTQRLRVNGTCRSLPATAATTRLDDATSPRLTDAAQRDYFRLRERIEISNKQLAGLQEYIRNQCLK